MKKSINNNEENDVSDYGRYDRAHIENMVQRYKRLSVGSVDPENVARYQAKLEEWERKKKVLDDLSKPFDVTENGKYEVLPYDTAEEYEKAIREEYLAQNISPEDNATIWAEDGGYIQNSDGYTAINNYLRGVDDAPLAPKYTKTIETLNRMTTSLKLKKNYVGYRKVNCEYLQNVLGISIEGLTKNKRMRTKLGGLRRTVVPKDKKAAQTIVELLNKMCGTESAKILDKAFTSISMCEKVNYFTHYPIQFEIQMPVGTRGLLTSNWAESEFITAPKTRLEMLRAEVYNDGEKDCIRIFAKLVQGV